MKRKRTVRERADDAAANTYWWPKDSGITNATLVYFKEGWIRGYRAGRRKRP